MFSLRCFILFVLILLSNLSFSQTDVKDTTRYVDERGKFQGFEKHPDGFNLVYKEKIIKGYESWSAGYYKDGKMVGTWEITDDKGNLLGYRIYEEDGSYIEVQLRKKKPLSIIKYKVIAENKEDRTRTYEVVEILSFNKCGKFIKRYTADQEGK